MLLHSRGGAEARQYSGVILRYKQDKVRSLLHLLPDHKDYYYAPVVPRVRDGMMWKPYGPERMLATLNKRPPIDYSGECLYRQIEEQWFIKACLELKY
jgi:hypothetical protein